MANYPNEFDQSINVTQFGWSELDESGVTLIQDYIAQAQQLRDECLQAYEDIQLSLQNIPYIQDAYGYIFNAYEDFKIKYPDFLNKYNDFILKYLEVNNLIIQVNQDAAQISADKVLITLMYDELRVLKSQVDITKSEIDSTYSQILAIRDETESLKTQAQIAATEAQDAAEELKKGQVYRGLWDPKVLNAYPAKPITNSYWDVVIADGSASYVFDGKTWEPGQRLIYTLVTDLFEQGPGLQIGVTSFNGREGAVMPEVGDYTATLVGAEPVGTSATTVSNAINTLKGEPDPFPIYIKKSEIGTFIPVTTVNGRVGDVVVEEVWKVIQNSDLDLSGTNLLILADTISAPVNKVIPDTASQVLVKDISGNAGVNSITLTGGGSLTINGSTSETIDKDFGYVHYFKVGTNLVTIGGM